MIKNIIINIAVCLILLLNVSSFANSTNSINLKKDTTPSTDNTTQKIIDDFSDYAGTIKPEVREEIKKYRVDIVNINKKKRELYDRLSKEAQNFLAEEQKYKKKLSFSNIATEDDKENNTAKDNTDKDKK